MFYMLKNGELVSIVKEKRDVLFLLAAGIADDYFLMF